MSVIKSVGLVQNSYDPKIVDIAMTKTRSVVEGSGDNKVGKFRIIWGNFIDKIQNSPMPEIFKKIAFTFRLIEDTFNNPNINVKFAVEMAQVEVAENFSGNSNSDLNAKTENKGYTCFTRDNIVLGEDAKKFVNVLKNAFQVDDKIVKIKESVDVSKLQVTKELDVQVVSRLIAYFRVYVFENNIPITAKTFQEEFANWLRQDCMVTVSIKNEIMRRFAPNFQIKEQFGGVVCQVLDAPLSSTPGDLLTIDFCQREEENLLSRVLFHPIDSLELGLQQLKDNIAFLKEQLSGLLFSSASHSASPNPVHIEIPSTNSIYQPVTAAIRASSMGENKEYTVVDHFDIINAVLKNINVPQDDKDILLRNLETRQHTKSNVKVQVFKLVHLCIQSLNECNKGNQVDFFNLLKGILLDFSLEPHELLSNLQQLNDDIASSSQPTNAKNKDGVERYKTMNYQVVEVLKKLSLVDSVLEDSLLLNMARIRKDDHEKYQAVLGIIFFISVLDNPNEIKSCIEKLNNDLSNDIKIDKKYFEDFKSSFGTEIWGNLTYKLDKLPEISDLDGDAAKAELNRLVDNYATEIIKSTITEIRVLISGLTEKAKKNNQQRIVINNHISLMKTIDKISTTRSFAVFRAILVMLKETTPDNVLSVLEGLNSVLPSNNLSNDKIITKINKTQKE